MILITIFTMRLLVIQREGLSVRPSVCLSFKRVHCNKTKETCAHILIIYERTFILVVVVFRREE